MANVLAMRRTTWGAIRAGLLGHRLEVFFALSLTMVVAGLHVVRAVNAKALWRDEAGAVQLATMPSFRETARHFQHEAFPLLFPATVRAVNWLGGGSDVGFRLFGLVVGLAIVAALWLGLWLMCGRAPMLSLVLLGFNGPFIRWGDSVRGYGLGTLLVLFAAVLVWRFVEKPTAGRWAAAVLAAVASVQCLFHTPVLLLAICLGGSAVTLRRRDVKGTLAVLSIGAVAAASLAPYFGPLQHGRDWDVLVRSAVTLRGLGLKLVRTLAAPGPSGAWIWSGLFLVSLAVCVAGQVRPAVLPEDKPRRDRLLFCGVALICSVLGHFLFLKTLSYSTQDWYYLALMGFVALFLDAVSSLVQLSKWVRVVRLLFVLTVAVAAAPLTWHQVRVRQTNVDLVAKTLTRLADTRDLIVVTPWYNGISFGRYYKGSTDWATVPPIAAHEFHRFDLVKEEMSRPNPNDSLLPLLNRISRTLKEGHRVWVVGFLEAPVGDEPLVGSSSALGAQWHARLNSCYVAWSAELASQLRASAVRLETVSTGFNGPVSRFEDLPISRFDGVSQP
jgi:hypothetical protein